MAPPAFSFTRLRFFKIKIFQALCSLKHNFVTDFVADSQFAQDAVGKHLMSQVLADLAQTKFFIVLHAHPLRTW